MNIDNRKSRSGAANADLVPIIYARVLAGEVARSQGNARQLLIGTGLDTEHGAEPSTGLTLAQYRQLLANTLAITGDSLVVLKSAANLAPTIHGPTGLAVSASPDLAAALEVTERYVTLRNPFCRVRRWQDDTWVGVEIEIFEQLGNYKEQALDFMVASLAAAIRGTTAAPLSGLRWQLQRLEPDHADQYQQIVQCQVEFGQVANRFICHKSDLNTKMLGANPEVYQAAIDSCNALFSTRHRPLSLIDSIDNQLTRMSGQLCNIQTVASELGMSARTLQRRLQKLNTSYQVVLDDWLGRQAKRYLVQHQLSVEVTAILLGYTDEANFRRAFKRWFKVAPGVYKRNAQRV